MDFIDEKRINDYDYIDDIIKILNFSEDQELKELVFKLIKERNNLVDVLNVDPLTGVYNRRILDRIRDFTTVAICDVDDFKAINDTFGHQVGDKALQLVSQILAQNSRVNDYVCRFGGDEFLIVFCGADEEIVKKRMASVLQSVNNISVSPNYRLSLSIGISSYKPGNTLLTIIDEADKALYVSKNSGKNTINSYSDLILNSSQNSRQI